MTPKFFLPLAVSRRERDDRNLVVVSIRGAPARVPIGICSRIGNGKRFPTMILREPKAIGLVHSVVIAETAVVDAVVVVVGVVETSVRVRRIVRRPGSVRLATNAVLLRQRPLRAAILVIGRDVREAGIVLAAIVVHEKIGRAVSVVRNGMSVGAKNLDRSRPPVSQQCLPYSQPAGSMISVLEFLKSNLKPLRVRPASPTRYLRIGLARSPLRKVREQRMLFCETVADQQLGRLRMNSSGPTMIRTCNRHRSAVWLRRRDFRRPKRRASRMKWWRPLMLSHWSRTMRHCVRAAAVAVVVAPVRSRGRHRHQMATKGPRLISVMPWPQTVSLPISFPPLLQMTPE